MIKKADTFNIYCDNCGGQFCDLNEHTSWNDINQVKGELEAMLWYTTKNGQHYCVDCYCFDTNGYLTIDESKSKWKNIPGYNGRYQMNILGRIRSVKELIVGTQVILTDTKGRRKNYLINKLYEMTFGKG